MTYIVRYISVLIYISLIVGCSGMVNENVPPKQETSNNLREDVLRIPGQDTVECTNMDGVYEGTLTNGYTGASAPMLLDVVQAECVVNGHIKIEAPLFTEGLIHGWVEGNKLNFMALDRQRMIILGEELHFEAQLDSNSSLSGTFYTLDPQENINDEGVWELDVFELPVVK